jgi:bacterial/archaeal transporter family protein
MSATISRWLPFALLTCVFWGLFGFLAKVGSGSASSLDLQILFTLGTLPIAAFIAVKRSGLRATNKGRLMGSLIGILAGLGGIAYFIAMAGGKVSIVGPLTSLFPLVTVALATIFLREGLNRVQMAGVVLAVVAGALLSF